MVKNEIMTTKELAGYIRMNEKTVIKLAQNGELPGVKIANKWRFSLESVDKFLQNGLIKSKGQDLNLVIDTAKEIVPLAKLTNESLICENSLSKDKKSLLHEMSTIAYDEELTLSQSNLYLELEKREKMLSTAVGNGVALPHPRHASEELFKEPHLIIIRSKKGILFRAPDKKKVNLFFMICAPSEFVHLRLMAKIAKLLHTENVVDKFLKAENKEDFIRILMKFDQEQLFPIRNHVRLN